MRILSIPKNLEIGGTQVAAVEIALGLADRSHTVWVASEAGPLVERLDSRIGFVPLPSTRRRLARLAALRRLMVELEPDVVHAFEVRNVMDACLALHSGRPRPLLGSIFSTRVPWFLPEEVPLTVAAPSLLSFTRRWRTGPVSLLRPPIALEPVGSPPDHLELDDHQHLVVLVSRLVEDFKREAILRIIAAVQDLASWGFALSIVGDGPARPSYERAAAAANEAAGRRIVAFQGATLDPLPFIAAARLVVGNGMSVMAGVGLEKPAIVVGREGFSKMVTPDNIEELAHAGFYGVGDGLRWPDPLVDQMISALDVPQHALEESARWVWERYGVPSAAEEAEAALLRAHDAPLPTWSDIARSFGRVVHYRTRRLILRRVATRRALVAEHADDFVYGRLRNLALDPRVK
jgi:hypothetical protein